MKQLLLISTLISLMNCNTPTEKKQENKLNRHEIYEVIKAIVNDDKILQPTIDPNKPKVCIELDRLNIYVPVMTKDGPQIPPVQPATSILSLLYQQRDSLFQLKDSVFLLEQNNNPLVFKLDSSLKIKNAFATKEEINKPGNQSTYYTMTIPVFSSDYQTAYVELNYYCGALCGHGLSIYLIKRNNYWQIFDIHQKWIA